MKSSRYKLQSWLNEWERTIRAAKRNHRGSKKERAVIQEMYKRLHTVSRAVADDDLDTAVFSAVEFGLWAGEFGGLIGHVERSRKGGANKPMQDIIDDATKLHTEKKLSKAEAAKRACKTHGRGRPEYIARKI